MTTTTSPNDEFTHPVAEDDLERTAQALRDRGFDAHFAPAGETARMLVAGLIPGDAEVLTAPSETLRQTGIAADIDESGRCDAVRPELTKLDYVTEGRCTATSRGRTRRDRRQRSGDHRGRPDRARVGDRESDRAGRIRRPAGDLGRRRPELIVDGERCPGRISIVLLNQPLGF